MGKTIKVAPNKFRFFGKASFSQSRGKFFHLYIPLHVATLLGITTTDQASIYMNVEKRELHIKIQAKRK